MVARAVEALVVRTSDRRERGEKRRARDNALGLVGMKANLLPLADGQRPGPLPGAGADRDAAEVVDERRAADRSRARGVQPAALCRRGGELRDTGRVAREVRRDQVRESAHRRERPVDRLSLERQAGLWLTGEHLIPSRRLRIEREDLVGVVGKARGHVRIEPAAGAVAGEPRRVLYAADPTLEDGVDGDVDDPHWQRDLLALGPSK